MGLVWTYIDYTERTIPECVQRMMHPEWYSGPEEERDEFHRIVEYIAGFKDCKSYEEYTQCEDVQTGCVPIFKSSAVQCLIKRMWAILDRIM